MKLAALALALVLSSLTALSAADSMQGMEMRKDGQAASHRASGVVKSVNPEKGVVTIAHGPVPALKWPAMTMGFTAQDRQLLQNLKPGARVEFEFVQQGSRYIITSIK